MSLEKKVFPVYLFSVHYTDGTQLMEIAYIENMYRQELTDEEAKAEMCDFMYMFELDYPDIAKKFIKMELDVVRWEEWHSEYFFHFTFQRFENEESAFASFRGFIKAKVEERSKLGINAQEDADDDLEEVQDETLWRVCTCEECKQQGKTEIYHSKFFRFAD